MASIQTQQKSTNEEEDFLFAWQITTDSILPFVMRAVIELNLFEIIAKAGPGAQMSLNNIASHLPIKNQEGRNMLDRILHLLASHSVLTSSLVTRDNGSVERLYGLTPACKYFVQNQDGISTSPWLLLVHDKVFIDSWYHLKDAILDGGIPFNKAHGMHAFEYPGIDPKFNELFNKTMLNHSTLVMKKVLETYKGFEHLKEIIDVGGGLGTTISMITSKYPNIKGINFDLPHVIKAAPSYPGVEHIGGNMFESVPNGQTIFMKWILHDWDDKSCLKLLKHCYNALPDQGKLIVFDAILPATPETNTTAQGIFRFDIAMLTQNPGGKERNEEEFHVLAKGAGFTKMKKVCPIYNSWIMEFLKK